MTHLLIKHVVHVSINASFHLSFPNSLTQILVYKNSSLSWNQRKGTIFSFPTMAATTLNNSSCLLQPKSSSTARLNPSSLLKPSKSRSISDVFEIYDWSLIFFVLSVIRSFVFGEESWTCRYESFD